MRIIFRNILLRVQSSTFQYPSANISQLKLLQHNTSCADIGIFSRSMSQKSITSFFRVTPRQAVPSNEDDEKKTTKRLMLYSSDSEPELKPLEMSPPPYMTKKYRVKRRRIDSSESEASLSSDSGSESPHVKVEHISCIKTYESPKSKKAKLNEKTKRLRVNSSGSDTSKGSESPHIKKENIKTYESPKVKKAKLSNKSTPVLKKNNIQETNNPTKVDKGEIHESDTSTKRTKVDENITCRPATPINVEKDKICESSSPTEVEKDVIPDISCSTKVDNNINHETSMTKEEVNPTEKDRDESLETCSPIKIVKNIINETSIPTQVHKDKTQESSSPSTEEKGEMPENSNDTKAIPLDKEEIREPSSPSKPIKKEILKSSPIKVENEKIYDSSSPTKVDKDEIRKPTSPSEVGKDETSDPSILSKKAKCGIRKPSSPIKVDKYEIGGPSSSVKVKDEAVSPVTEKITKKEYVGSASNEDDIQLPTVPEHEYDPGKRKYNPVSDACWRRGAPVPYLALARTLAAIEVTSSRLRIAEILANYFRSVIALTPQDLLPSIYMCLNQLAPAYHGLELGMAETYLMKAVGQCTGMTVGQVRASARRCGDLGTAAGNARRVQRCVRQPPPLHARHVFASLKDIARMTGQAAVSKKIARIQSMFTACRGCEAKYLIRSLEGKLRIGLAEQTMLQALAIATVFTPPGQGAIVLNATKGLTQEQIKERVEANALTIKTTYCECPNYEALVEAMLQYGVAELPEHCRLTVGVPLKPMLAQPARAVSEALRRFENERFTCEWKYDGERAQIHVPEAEDGAGPNLAKAAIFSRSQENNTSKYPDVLSRLPGLLKESVKSCVLDCEVVAFDTNTKQILPFQILSTRKRKDAAADGGGVHVCAFAFDLLYFNGSPLVRLPLEERRALLREHFNAVPGEWELATSKDCTDVEEVQEFLEEAVRGGCEGLMVKALEGTRSHYDIARRSRNWLKLKKDYLEGGGDSVDVVVVGAYHGKGRRAGAYGGFLLACYEPFADEYQTLCKLGTGFSDDDLRTLSDALRPHAIQYPKQYYRYDSAHTPDVWLAPSQVWEVRGADVSLSPTHRAAQGMAAADRGLSLRFPRFVRVRDDKTPEQATSAQQIMDMYMAQDQVRNNAGHARDHAEDYY